ERVFRYWQRGLAKLRAMGLEPVGVCVFEVNHCRPLEGSEFVEPHVHAAIRGATVDQVKSAFSVRKLATDVRRRPTKVQKVYDLPGLLSYFTKFEPSLRV